MSNPRYVIWDGRTQKDYYWNGSHDCAVTYDNHLISVHKVRQFALSKGIEPITIFTCQVGKPSLEINLGDEGWHGLGTYCLCKVIRENPDISVRDLITRTNELIVEMGFDQVSEVICNEELLDHPVSNNPPYHKAVFLMLMDICRTPSEPGQYICDHDKFSP